MDQKEWQEKGAGHRQRLREKFLALGGEAFTDAETLELLLSFGTPRKDCKEQARALLKRFGSFAAVLDAPQAELEKIEGVGPKNTFAIHFVHAAARRYLRHDLQTKEYIQSSKEVSAYLIHAMRGMDREILLALFLDAGHAILGDEILSEGTLTTNTVYPRELIKMALRYNAAAVIIAHNHPSGTLKPSKEDRRLTRNLYFALASVNITLLDHFIVAGSAPPYSFADHGHMEAVRNEWKSLG